MAESESTTVAPGVTRNDNYWGYTLEGAKDALLASGVAKEEWFWNGRRSANGRKLKTVFFKIDGNRAKCHPYCGAEDEYQIEVNYPKEVADKGRKARQQELAVEIPTTHLRSGVCIVFGAFNPENDPEKQWRFPTETVEQVKRHLREIMLLFEKGGFEIRRDSTFEVDAGFQRFMQVAQGNPTAPPG